MYQSTSEHITKDARPDASKHASKNILSRPPLNISAKWGKIPHRSNSLCKQSGLIYKTMESLQQCLIKERGNELSEALWLALEDLVLTLEKMANGEAKAVHYLSPLDPGIGKTTAIIHFITHLLKSQKHEEVGVILFVDTRQQIRDLIDAFKEHGLEQKDYAVFISDNDENKELNELNADRDNARVLITTQQMLLSRTKRHRSFSECREFYYNGNPREVRAWDEAMLPARPLRVDVTKIQAMFDSLIMDNMDAVIALEKLIELIRETKCGDSISIPDFGLDQNDMNMIFSGSDHSESIRNAAFDLCALKNKDAVVIKSGNKTTALEYENHIPDDLKPILITDASGRVRGTYAQWYNNRDDLVILRKSHKSYSNLNAHVWERGGGKTSWKDASKRDVLIEGVATVINHKRNEDWLVIHHLNNFGVGNIDIPCMIKDRLIEGSGKIHFAHWGGEGAKATNDYRDVSNIILAGTLFYDDAHIEALLRLSGDIPAARKTDKYELDKIRAGEHSHLILQAACRGSVRKSLGNNCHPCELYIIASKKSGIKKLLASKDRGIFPGCKVHAWSPVRKALKGKVKDAFEFVLEYFTSPQPESENGVKDTLTASKVRKAIAMDSSNFRSRVMIQPMFIEALEEYGLSVITQSGRQGSYFTSATTD